MRILVTGAFGNIGRHAAPLLLARGHQVRALSEKGGADHKTAARWRGDVEVFVGDVRDAERMAAAVDGQDVVIHLAFVIPPRCLEEPAASRAINVGGTRNLIEAARRAARPPRLLFASTLDVFGHTQHLPPPRRVTDPVAATDCYAEDKIACEALVTNSGLDWLIFRFADVPPIALRRPIPMMFRIPLTTRIEMIHPDDAALAIANAVDKLDVWRRLLLIGGGARCQLTYGEYLGGFLDAMGIGALPAPAFSSEPYCTDWLDTDESQRLLGYQRHSYADVVRETGALLGWRRYAVALLRPLLRRYILRLSPHLGA